MLICTENFRFWIVVSNSKLVNNQENLENTIKQKKTGRPSGSKNIRDGLDKLLSFPKKT